MKSFREKMRFWIVWPALGLMGISCALLSPKPTEAPPPVSEPVAAPKQVMDAPRQPVVAPQKAPPAALPAGAEPALGHQETAPPAPPVKVEPKPKESFYVHTVRYSGETISIIAAWYTGNGENWKALARANPQIDPKLIFEGNEILIPETLLKTREAMPQKFVNRFYTKSVKEKSRPKSQPAQPQEEDLKLFGPKKSNK
jgi:hypothetical protein